MSTKPNPLQAAAQYFAPPPQKEFEKTPTFEAFINKNPDFHRWEPDEKTEIANKFFSEKTADFAPDEKQEAGALFSQTYGIPVDVPQVDMTPTQSGSPLDVLPGLLSGAADVGSFITQPVEKLLNTGVDRYRVQNEAAYQNNPYFKAGADVGSTASDLAGYGLAALGGLPGIAAYSANKNIQKAAGGEQNVGQAVFNTGLDTVFGKLSPSSNSIVGAAVKNAGLGGLANTASYTGNQLLTGQPLTLQGALQATGEGLKQGAIVGGATHAAAVPGGRILPEKADLPKVFQPKPVKIEPTVKVRNLDDARLRGDQMRAIRGQAKQIKNYSNDKLASIKASESLDPQRNAKSQIDKLNSLYSQLHQLETAKGTPLAVKARVQKQKAQVKREYESRKSEYDKKYVQPAKDTAEKKRLKAELDRREAQGKAEQRRQQSIKDRQANAEAAHQRRVKEIKLKAQAHKEILQGKASTEAQKQAAREALIKLKAEVKASEQERDYRNKQALQSQKPASKSKPKAEPKAEGRETIHPAKKAGDIERYTKQDKLPGLEKPEIANHPEVQRRPELIGKLDKSYRNNEYIKPDYAAEIHGTEVDKPKGEGVVVQGISQTKSGDIQVKMVDSEGQYRTYKLADGKDTSYLNNATLTGKKSPFENVGDMEDLTKSGTPRQRVLDTRSNTLVEVFKPGEQKKTSEIKAAYDKLTESLNQAAKGETVAKSKIIDSISKLNNEDLTAVVEKMTPEQRSELHRKLTGEPC